MCLQQFYYLIYHAPGNNGLNYQVNDAQENSTEDLDNLVTTPNSITCRTIQNNSQEERQEVDLLVMNALRDTKQDPG